MHLFVYCGITLGLADYANRKVNDVGRNGYAQHIQVGIGIVIAGVIGQYDVFGYCHKATYYIWALFQTTTIGKIADHAALRRPAMLIFSGKLSITEWIHGKAGELFWHYWVKNKECGIISC